MSEITGREAGLPGPAAASSPSTPSSASPRPTPVATAHESYAFACMRCGHGWEQDYTIEHHVDGKGNEFVTYLAEGHRVPSPLSRPTCLNCGGHVVRIMRAGRVSSVRDVARRLYEGPAEPAPGVGVTSPEPPSEGSGASEGEAHHWHLSDLLHPFRGRGNSSPSGD
ncbi:hypothetical protein DY218_00275 [Streptomyces triticagri]|uniref:C2H2-type domain-containing protein n=1 Tax=Streptomyces triticagri TaxID=2293568 RepID=A0A372MDK4_9ACTN|nr:hypothetical protein [Streptomyces triticagri]RFU88680.1 hypothetical protein DY218_00275 [Streptomyces triticagri]